MRKLVCVFVLLTNSTVAQSVNWQLAGDEGGILVYTREEAGSDIISLKGEATLAASTTAIFEILKDNSIAADWLPMVVEKRDVKAVNDQERLEYTHIKMPWPLTDRYFVNRARIDYPAGGVFHISVRSVEETDIVETDKVRGFIHLSELILTPVDGGKRTHMTIELNTDPRGSVPKWLVNLAQKNWPRNFFRGLITQLAKRGHLPTAEPALAH